MRRYSLRPYPSIGSRSPRDANFISHNFNELHADLDEGFDEGIGRGREPFD